MFTFHGKTYLHFWTKAAEHMSISHYTENRIFINPCFISCLELFYNMDILKNFRKKFNKKHLFQSLFLN